MIHDLRHIRAYLALARAGKREEAIRLFEKLCEECRTSWIERVGRQRLQQLRKPGD